MSIKQKLITIPTIIILLVALGVYYGAFDRNAMEHDKGRDVHLHLSVVWQLKRTKPVNISVTVDSALLAMEGKTISPWERDITVPVTALNTRVILAVFQEQSGDCECTILRDGVIGDHNWMTGPGNIACQVLIQ